MACASRTPSSMRRARLNAVLGGPEMSEQSTAMTDDDQAPAPDPPTAERVARRALVLAAVTCRGSIESDAESEDQLRRLAALMFSLHWRLRQFSLKADSMDFERFAGEAWFGPLEVDGLLFAEKDLAIHGVPVVRSARWRDVLSIARERQPAANWLAGHDPIYSEVGTDT